MTDASKYTGAHKSRFDAETGKGKGIEGRVDKTDNSGYVGNYKGAGTYDKTHWTQFSWSLWYKQCYRLDIENSWFSRPNTKYIERELYSCNKIIFIKLWNIYLKEMKYKLHP